MNHRPVRPSLPVLFALPTLVAFSARGDRIAFGPEAGLVLSKHYTSAEETILDEMSTVLNGEELGEEMNMDLEVTTRREVVLVDEYAAVSSARPTRLKRTFETLDGGVTSWVSNEMMGEITTEMTGASPLEGQTVVFTWDEEAGEFATAFAEEGPDEELLEGLVEDTDLRAFLPPTEVDEGDSWEIDPEAMRGLLAFGGALKVEMESQGENPMGAFGGDQPMPEPDVYLGVLDGELTAEFTGNIEADGLRLAVIQITFEISSANDLSEFFAEAIDESVPEEMSISYDAVDMEHELAGSATLQWNLEGGHAHSFQLAAKVVTAMDMAMTMDMMGQEMSVESSVVMQGDQNLSLRITEAD